MRKSRLALQTLEDICSSDKFMAKAWQMDDSLGGYSVSADPSSVEWKRSWSVDLQGQAKQWRKNRISENT